MIIYFNICAAILFVMLIFSVYFRGMTKGTKHQLFLLLLYTSLLCTMFDIVNVATNGHVTSSIRPLIYITHSGYFLLRSVTMPIYILYVISITDTWHKLSDSLLFKASLLLPYVIELVCIIINPFTQMVFYIDAAGYYHRGYLIAILYAGTAYYMGWCIFYILKNRCLFKRDKLYALLALFPLNIIAVLIQLFLPNYVVEMFVMAVACLAILITIQRPEESLDYTTGFGNNSAYLTDLKRTVINKKETDIILINIGNYNSLQDILGVESSTALNKMIAKSITDCLKSLKVRYEPYAVSNSRIRITVSDVYRTFTNEAASAINERLKQNFVFRGMQINLIAYVCTLSVPSDADDYETLISFGKNLHKTYAYTGEVLQAKNLISSTKYEIEKHIDSIIDNALANGLFEVYYQPIYNVKLERFTSAEALIRLKDERFGYISPEIFIPAAERNGTINKIGDYVLKEVCRFIASADFKGLGIEYIEVNLSVAQCMQSDLAEKTINLLNKYGVSPSQINLEITETATTHSQNIMEDNIMKLRSAGITFSLDDYGTGYSNMKSVASLPLDIIKLDKSLVNENNDPRIQSVLKNTVTMLKEMNLKILIEGIETEEMLIKFINLQCDYVQGFYFSKPIPQKAFVEFIKSSNAERSGQHLQELEKAKSVLGIKVGQQRY